MIASRCQFKQEAVAKINPQWIFLPHWSHWIPETIWSTLPTMILHMTDLPYGHGRSPFKNLIQRGYTSTMISVLCCEAGLDTGDVYLKKPLSLLGSAEEVFLRADQVIEDMIERIVREEPIATPQEGEAVLFSRRTPDQSDLSKCSRGDIHSWQNQIRMLDAEGYPHAYLDVNGMRLEFRRVAQRSDGLHADVRIAPIPHQQTPNPGPSS